MNKRIKLMVTIFLTTVIIVSAFGVVIIYNENKLNELEKENNMLKTRNVELESMLAHSNHMIYQLRVENAELLTILEQHGIR